MTSCLRKIFLIPAALDTCLKEHAKTHLVWAENELLNRKVFLAIVTELAGLFIAVPASPSSVYLSDFNANRRHHEAY